MNRFFLLCLTAYFAILSLPTRAQAIGSEWIVIGRTENFHAYLDQRSIQRNGDLARVYQLTDFTSAQWIDERTVMGSLKALVEYDCTQPQMRTLAIEAYSEQMASGRLLVNEQAANAEWGNIASGGSSEVVQRMVCGK